MLNAEKIAAPKFKYDFQLLSPGEFRNEYLAMMGFADQLDGDEAEQMREEASKLLKVEWASTAYNLVTTQGKNDLLDKYFKGSSYTAAWYLGLKGTGTAVVGDTAASHAGWAEVNPYAGNRPAITFGTSAAGSNTATAVSYTITGSATVAGAFVQSVDTGTTGILYSAGDFGASRAVVNGDTLNVTLTVSFS